MNTQTLGDLLRQARLKHDYSLEDMAAATHIKLEYLAALEDNQFEQLPAATFVKAYIRHYARLFELDIKPLLAILRRDYEESAKGQLILREAFLKQNPRLHFFSPVRLTVVAASSVFLMIFAYAMWQWYQLNQPPFLELQAPTENQEVAAQFVVRGRTRPDATVTVNAQPLAVQADGIFVTELYLAQEGSNIVTIKATDTRGKTNTMQRTVVVKF